MPSLTQTLPADTANALRRMHAEAIVDGRGSDARLRLVGFVQVLRMNEWTQASLATVLGVSRQAIDQMEDYPARFDGLPEVPMRPRRKSEIPRPPSKRRQLRVKPGVADELRRLQGLARTVRGPTPLDSPARAASVELSAMLAALVDQGVTICHLSKVLDVTRFAVVSRLSRHGYRKPSPSLASQPIYGTRVTKAALRVSA